MEEKKRPNLIQNFLQFFYGNFIVLLLGLVQVPLLTRILSEDQYGRTSLFLPAATILYNLAMVGMDQAYIRYFYKKGVDRRRLMRQCLRTPVMIVGALGAVYILFSGTFNWFLFGAHSADITALVLGYTFTSVFERLFFLNIRMEQNGRLYSNLYILSKMLNLSFIVLFYLWLGDDFRILLIANTLSLALVTGFVIARYVVRGRRERPGDAAAGAADIPPRELFLYGFPFILTMLIEQVQASCDKTFIRIFSTWSEQGVYNSAMQIMTILLTFKAAFVAFWAPVAMEKHERGDKEDSKAFFRSVYDKVQFFCVLAAFGLIFFRKLIVLFLGAKYRGAVTVIPFLTLMPILSIMFEITGQGIKFKGQIRYYNYASLLSILFNILGNYLLVPLLGGRGAAISTGLTYILYFAAGSYFSEKCYRVGYGFRKTAFYILLLTCYAAAAAFVQGDGWNLLLGGGGIALLCVLERRTISEAAGFVTAGFKKRKSGGA